MSLTKLLIQQALEDIRRVKTCLKLAEENIRQAWNDHFGLETYLLQAEENIRLAEKTIRLAEKYILLYQTYLPGRERWIEREKEQIQMAEENIRRSVCDLEVKPTDLKTKLIIRDKEIESDDCFRRNEDRYESEVYSQGQRNVAYIGQPSVYDSNEDQRSCSWQRRLYNVKKNGPERRQPFVSFDTNTNQRSCAWRRRKYMIMQGLHVDDYNTQLVWIPMMSRWKRTKKKHLTDTCVVSEWPDKWKRRPNIHLSLKLSVKAGCIESENVRVINTWGNYLVSVLSFCVYATDVDLQEILGSHLRKCSNHKKRKGKSLGSKMIKIITIEAAPPDKQFR